MRQGSLSDGDDGEVASLFDRESARYDADYDAPRGHQLRARFDAVLAALGPGPGEVLDAGMGPGRMCAELERRGWTATGVDLSEAMVRLARRRLPHAGERLLQGGIEALPFDDARFDAVVVMGVLEYLDDFPAALGEVARVLRPGARLVVSFPHPLSVEGIWRRHVWNPAVRAVKSAVPIASRSAPYRPPPAITTRGMLDAMRAAGLRPDRSRHVSYSLRAAGIGDWAGAVGLSLVERIESARPNVARPLANHVVLLAHRPAGRVVDGKDEVRVGTGS